MSGMSADFRELMERYNRLGRMLPAPEDYDTDDAAAVAEAKLVLREMDQTLSTLKAILRTQQ